jgi:hypothetical protein
MCASGNPGLHPDCPNCVIRLELRCRDHIKVAATAAEARKEIKDRSEKKAMTFAMCRVRCV